MACRIRTHAGRQLAVQKWAIHAFGIFDSGFKNVSRNWKSTTQRPMPLAATALLPLRVPSIQQSVDWWFARKLTTVLCPLFSDAFKAFVRLDGSLVLLALKTSQHHLLLF